MNTQCFFFEIFFYLLNLCVCDYTLEEQKKERNGNRTHKMYRQPIKFGTGFSQCLHRDVDLLTLPYVAELWQLSESVLILSKATFCHAECDGVFKVL